MSFLKILAEDKKLVLYRPALRAIAKTVSATILLSQLIYWDSVEGGEFWKPVEPVSAPVGVEARTSWTEELGFSPSQFRTASLELQRQGLLTKTQKGRYIYWELNREMLELKVAEIYGKEPERETDEISRLKAEIERLKKENEKLANSTKTPVAKVIEADEIIEAQIDSETEIEPEELIDVEFENVKSNASHIEITLYDVVKEVDKLGYPRESAQRFFNHYETLGWMKGNYPIKDFRPLLRNWVMRDKKIESKDVQTLAQLRRFLGAMPPSKRERLVIPLSKGDYGINSKGHLIHLESGEKHPQEAEFYQELVLGRIDNFIKENLT